MHPPRGFADLAGRAVGVFGYGVEGRATVARLLTVGVVPVVVDDVAETDTGVLATDRGGHDALLRCDVVLKGPGIPARRDDVAALRARGVTVTSALNLWLLETNRARVIAVTGTKGKSTTTALTTFALTACGQSARSAGNIGVPPYDPDLAPATFTVLEVSSFQAVDLEAAPSTVVVTALGADHLDWHGTVEQYVADKLSVTRAAGPHTTLLADQPELLAQRTQIGGLITVVSATLGQLTTRLGLLGTHNVSNLSLAVAAAAQAANLEERDVVAAVAAHAETFTPLPGRLTALRTLDGVRYVDDGLATAPLPAVAALAVFGSEPVALIAGGQDRGVDYGPLADALGARTEPTVVVVMGKAGERIAASLAGHPSVVVHRADDLADAVRAARAAVDHGVVLLSPAAPSFDRYPNWRARSDEFARIVGALTSPRA